MKASLLATGYGQDFLDSPASKGFPTSAFFLDGYKPVELKTAATKKLQADLKKYTGYTGVPDFGVYNGYILADFLIKACENAGKNPTRASLMAAARNRNWVNPYALKGSITKTGKGDGFPLDQGKITRYSNGSFSEISPLYKGR